MSKRTACLSANEQPFKTRFARTYTRVVRQYEDKSRATAARTFNPDITCHLLSSWYATEKRKKIERKVILTVLNNLSDHYSRGCLAENQGFLLDLGRCF